MSHTTDPGAVLAQCWAILQADPEHVFSWSELGHPSWDGSPVWASPNGPVQVPPHPPRPGRRLVDVATY